MLIAYTDAIPDVRKLYMWQSLNIILLRILIASLCFECSISELLLRAGLILCDAYSCVDSCCIYTACFSPALNGRSEIWRFERSDVIKFHDGIIFHS